MRDSIENIYTLTPLQEGMLFSSLYDRNSPAYFLQTVFTIEGALDMAILKKSFELLVQRYDVLRTVFLYEQSDRPLQVVLKERGIELNYRDISCMEQDDRKEFAGTFRMNDRERGFDLSKDILMRISVLKEGQDSYLLIWSYHHILMDGWCLGIIFNDLLSIYTALKNRTTPQLMEITPYSRYVEWLEKQDKEEAEAYWREYLDGYERQAKLPGYRKSEVDGYKLEKLDLMLDESLTGRLEDIAVRCNVTVNVVFQTLWGILLQKYNGVSDVVFGMVISGRWPDVNGIENMAGLFINTIPVRVRCSGTVPFSTLVRQLQEAVLASESYGYVSLAEIQSYSSVKQGLADHVVAFENYPVNREIENIEKNFDTGFKITGAESFEQTSYDFDVTVTPGSRLLITFSYNSQAYESQIVSKLAGHLKEIIKQIAGDMDIEVGRINIITENEKKEILYSFNNTATPLSDKTLQQLFREWAERCPSKTAVTFGNSGISFGGLYEKSNRLARVLKKNGLGSECTAGILTERSIDLVTGIMGIFMAGGAYVPIDPGYPEERIAYMLEDSGIKLLVTHGNLYEGLRFQGTIINLDDESSYDDVDGSSPGDINMQKDLAYVIYTSGSTGKPKGAMLEHAGMINHITAMINDLKIDENSVIAQNASQCCDISVWQLLTGLAAGCRTVIYPKELIVEPSLFIDRIIEDGITILEVVPSYLSVLMDILRQKQKTLQTLKCVLVTGEALPPGLAERWQGMGIPARMINAYGPTEASDDISLYTVDGSPGNESIPIGKPIQNIRIYITDEAMNLCPVGVKGEICVAGTGVGRGYINDPLRTAQAFMDDPFIEGEKSRLYKTGNIGCWLSDGNISFFGRKDHQINIRGFRVELGEIESRLAFIDGIKEVAVVDRLDKNGDVQICAFLVSDSTVSVQQIKEELKTRLPLQMIPSQIIKLDEMPHLPNGKADRRSLRDLEGAASDLQATATAFNEIEAKLAEIWKEIIGVDRISIEDSFFEIGGHSLKATILASRLHREFDVIIPIGEIFKSPTIKGMAGYIRNAGKERYSNIAPAGESEYYPLSSAEKRLFLYEQVTSGTTEYNMTAGKLADGKIDIAKMERAFIELIKRHETLRTSFRFINGEPVQLVHKYVHFRLEIINPRRMPGECEDDVIRKAAELFKRPFDLAEAPLFRAGLVRLSENRYFLIYEIHHIISDGESINILEREFAALYGGRDLPPLRIQYKDFAVWQNSLYSTGYITAQQEYWLRRFSGEVPELGLPLDFPRSSVKTFNGDSVELRADSELTWKLILLAVETGTTIYMILLAAYNILLFRYTGKEDIIVGSPASGRLHADLENIVGMFVNTLAMRNSPRADNTFCEFLGSVRDNTLKAYDNQDYQFEMLMDKLKLKRESDWNPLFSAVFALQNTGDSDAEIDGLKFEAYDRMDYKIAKVDLLLNARETNGEIEMVMGYLTELFKRSSIETMAGHYMDILSQVAENPGIRLKDISLDSGVMVASVNITANEEDFEF